MKRKNIGSDSPWEDVVGYSRAVQVGDWLLISGTTAVQDGVVQFKGDMEKQALFILDKIRDQLLKCNMSLSDVVRSRIYVTDISRWEEVALAHAEYFGKIKPAATMVEVSRLIDSGLLVEIEIDAFKTTP